jgi:hypothetical protein
MKYPWIDRLWVNYTLADLQAVDVSGMDQLQWVERMILRTAVTSRNREVLESIRSNP